MGRRSDACSTGDRTSLGPASSLRRTRVVSNAATRYTYRARQSPMLAAHDESCTKIAPNVTDELSNRQADGPDDCVTCYTRSCNLVSRLRRLGETLNPP